MLLLCNRAGASSPQRGNIASGGRRPMGRRARSVLAAVICFTCTFAILPRVAWAQGTSAASIAGVVKDTSGAVLPGVTVEAASPALIEKVRTTVTDEKGE